MLEDTWDQGLLPQESRWRRRLTVFDRKFWQENLPRLKFWNPKVPMIVNRRPEPQGPATLTLYLRDGKATGELSQPSSSTEGLSKAPQPVEGEKAVVVDVKGLHSTEILEALMAKTSAVPVQPTPEEEAEMKDIEELRRRGEIDRQENRKKLEELRKEKARLAQAMSEAAAIKAAAQ
ncbi:hypothetical protein OQA88_11394 [Cercophora sp. LCS_1]